MFDSLPLVIFTIVALVSIYLLYRLRFERLAFSVGVVMYGFLFVVAVYVMTSGVPEYCSPVVFP